jgi:glycosyltransferase involved in cell wall biosynthesis
MDFFVKEHQPNMVQTWVNGTLENNLSHYDIVFFVDYWNLALPLFQFKKMIENPDIKFIGLCHGTVKLPNDVANTIPTAEAYEDYLKAAYHAIIVHDHWVKELMAGLIPSNLIVAGLPVDQAAGRVRPEPPPNNRVIYAHRFEPDKGCHLFLEFVKRCRRSGSQYLNETMFYVTGPHETRFTNLGIIATGRLSQNALKHLCINGGYAWSSVNSELGGYAIQDLCSYGLTPLLNRHKAYNPYPDRFKYRNLYEAVNIIKNEVVMSNEEWRYVLQPQLNNSKLIAEAILHGSIS